MKQIFCEICKILVAEFASGTMRRPGTVMVCKECAEIYFGGGSSAESCVVVEDLFKMMGIGNRKSTLAD